jgi:hypothetical protein
MGKDQSSKRNYNYIYTDIGYIYLNNSDLDKKQKSEEN